VIAVPNSVEPIHGDAMPTVPVTGNAEADELNATNPLALLLSMLLDCNKPRK
jgi:hypothetical protein